MNARDELAMLVHRYYGTEGWRTSLGAANVILAAGFRKPRTITAREELDALPAQAVIRGKWLADKWADPEGEMWHVAGKGMNWDTEQLIQRGILPATVLYEGEK